MNAVDWADRDAAAEHLANIAVRLAYAVREDPPAVVHRWLARAVPPEEMLAFAVICAAHIPLDLPMRAGLLDWITNPLARWRHAHTEHERYKRAGRRPPARIRRGESAYQAAYWRHKTGAA